MRFQRAEDVLKVAKPCDIIEFDRRGQVYKHYAFYIGGGVCVHVTGPAGSTVSSSGLMTNSASRASAAVQRSMCGSKSAELLVVIAGGDKCRIKNFRKVATRRGMQRRSELEAKTLALKGLQTDMWGKPILGNGIPIEYQLLSTRNCEGYVTSWKYDTPAGFSRQAEKVETATTVGTVVGAIALAVAAVVKVVGASTQSNRKQ